MRPLLLCSLLVSSTAFAQEPPPPPPPTPTPAGTDVGPAPSPSGAFLPGLLSTAPGATLELQLDYVDLDGADVTILGVMGHIQYITPQGMGGYVRVPMTYIDEDVFGMGGGDTTEIGNVEVGGLFVNKQSPTTDLYFRGGVSIDTTDGAEAAFANLFGHIFPRITDGFTASGLDSTWARGQVGMVASSGVLRYGGMAGIDIPVEGDVTDDDSFPDALLNLIGTIGIEQGEFSGGASMQMVQSIGADDDENAINIVLGGAFAINPQMRLFAAIALNVDGFGDAFDGSAVGVGIRAQM